MWYVNNLERKREKKEKSRVPNIWLSAYLFESGTSQLTGIPRPMGESNASVPWTWLVSSKGPCPFQLQANLYSQIWEHGGAMAIMEKLEPNV